MKLTSLSLRWTSRITFIACIVFLLTGIFSKSFAVPTDETPDALAAANAWLAQIDTGKYDESYASGCIAFHEKLTPDKWNLVLKAIRAPHGSVQSRKDTSRIPKPDGFEGLDGPCMIIEYYTIFKNSIASEQVVMKKENGKWKGAGYSLGPKSTSDPAPVTTITTETVPAASAPAPATK